MKLQNTERERKRKEWGRRERSRDPKSSGEQGQVIYQGMKSRLIRDFPTATTEMTR